MANYKKEKIQINDNSFDFEMARDEWLVLCLWDELPDSFKTNSLIDRVFQLAQLSQDLIIKMNINRLNND